MAKLLSIREVALITREPYSRLYKRVERSGFMPVRDKQGVERYHIAAFLTTRDLLKVLQETKQDA